MDEILISSLAASFLSALGLAALLLGYKQRSRILKHLWLPAQNARKIKTKHNLRVLYFLLACLCLIVILAAPLAKNPTTVHTAYVTYVVDTSKSQAAEKPLGSQNQLQKSKAIIHEVCDTFPDIHTSLYAFTQITRSHAYFSKSPSSKHNCGYIKRTLDNVLAIESVTQSGSDIAEALLISSESFPPGSEPRIMVLFTDGEYTNTPDEFVQAFAAIKKKNITLLVVGTGEESGAYIPIYNEKSGQLIDVERDYGKKVVVALRPQTLRAIAQEVDGKYFSADANDKLLAEIEINLKEKEENLENFYSSWKLVFAGGFFLAGLLFLRSVV